jgi:hypothetical protein
MFAKPRGHYPGHSKNVSPVLDVEHRCIIKVFVEKSVKGVEIVNRLNEHYE